MMKKTKSYNRTPLANIDRTDIAMSAEKIRNTLRNIAYPLDANVDEIKSIFYWQESNGMHVVHIRKKDDTVTLLRFVPN